MLTCVHGTPAPFANRRLRHRPALSPVRAEAVPAPTPSLPGRARSHSKLLRSIRFFCHKPLAEESIRAATFGAPFCTAS